MTIREQVQDGQYLANQIVAKIEQEIAQRNLKYTAIATLKDELLVFVKTLNTPKN